MVESDANSLRLSWNINPLNAVNHGVDCDLCVYKYVVGRCATFFHVIFYYYVAFFVVVAVAVNVDDGEYFLVSSY